MYSASEFSSSSICLAGREVRLRISDFVKWDYFIKLYIFLPTGEMCYRFLATFSASASFIYLVIDYKRMIINWRLINTISHLTYVMHFLIWRLSIRIWRKNGSFEYIIRLFKMIVSSSHFKKEFDVSKAELIGEGNFAQVHFVLSRFSECSMLNHRPTWPSVGSTGI